jgi:hypothetical protein
MSKNPAPVLKVGSLALIPAADGAQHGTAVITLSLGAPRLASTGKSIILAAESTSFVGALTLDASMVKMLALPASHVGKVMQVRVQAQCYGRIGTVEAAFKMD